MLLSIKLSVCLSLYAFSSSLRMYVLSSLGFPCWCSLSRLVHAACLVGNGASFKNSRGTVVVVVVVCDSGGRGGDIIIIHIVFVVIHVFFFFFSSSSLFLLLLL